MIAEPDIRRWVNPLTGFNVNHAVHIAGPDLTFGEATMITNFNC